MEDIIAKIPEGADFALLEDFNIDLQASTNSSRRMLLWFANLHYLDQLFKKPTRIIEHSSTVIDLFFVNNSHRVVDSGVVPLTISDLSVRWVRKGKSGPLERAELANQIQGFRIPDR